MRLYQKSDINLCYSSQMLHQNRNIKSEDDSFCISIQHKFHIHSKDNVVYFAIIHIF
jgi:hypothetical protein